MFSVTLGARRSGRRASSSGEGKNARIGRSSSITALTRSSARARSASEIEGTSTSMVQLVSPSRADTVGAAALVEQGARHQVLARVQRHVHPPARLVDAPARSVADRGQRRAAQGVVDAHVVVDLHVHHLEASVAHPQLPVIGHLPAGLGVERRAIEHDRGLAGDDRRLDDRRLEVHEQRVLEIEARGRCGHARRRALSACRGPCR
jgi:hypothetical protein